MEQIVDRIQEVDLNLEVEVEDDTNDVDELEFDRETLSDYLAMVHRC